MTPTRWSKRPRAAGTALGVAAVALLVPLVPGPAAAQTAGDAVVPYDRLERTPVRTGTSPDRSPALRPTDGAVVLQVELTTPAAGSAFAGRRSQGLRAAASAAATQAAAVRTAQDALVTRLAHPATRGSVLFRTATLTNAVFVRTDARRAAAIAALPGVASVTPVAAKFRQNASAVPLTGTPAAWEAHGTGDGVNIAIVDTGVDFTHADLGGAGTEEAFEAADATDTVITPDVVSATGTVVVDNFPTAKVVQGFDLVGDDYNAGYEEAGLVLDSPNAVPRPDPNPLDCNGHGTHVAGTTSGTGVNADGTPYTGPYSSSTPFDALKIGPGTAPRSTVSAYRVFGCEGASFIVSQALDLIAATRTDNDPANDVDVMNLSLGADFTRADDPDAQNIDKLAVLGVVPVVSSGNPGDLYASAGSPGSAVRALTVAATDDGAAIVDGLLVTAPSSIAGVLPGLLSVRYDYSTKPGITNAAVGRPTRTDSCAAYSPSDAALVAGKVALVDAAGFACGSVAKTGNAKAAGAIGVIIIGDDDSLSTGITGDFDVPAIAVRASDGPALIAALPDLRVSLTPESQDATRFTNPALVDTPAGFTARGGTLAPGLLKPDLAAPGVSITSADVGTGSGALTISGTSMAAPHAAGIAALVLQAHPAYTPEQVKAAMVNTAVTDVVSEQGDPDALTYTPARVGTGRVHADLATSTEVIAYASGGTGSVGVGLGPVDVTTPTQVITRGVTVRNFGTTARTYALSTRDDLAVPGATWAVSPASMTVPAGGTSEVTLTLTLDRAALRKSQDPTFDAQFEEETEHFIAESLGKLLLTPASGTELRVAYGAAPRPASTMRAARPALEFPASGGTAALPLTGAGVTNGPLGETTSVNSVVSAYQLQVSSPRLPDCSALASGDLQPAGCVVFPSQRAADLRYVGAASTVPVDGAADGLAVFGLATYATWTTPSWNYPGSFVGDVRFRVFVDVDGNGTDDRLVDVERLFDDTDLLAANLYDISGLPVGFTDDELKASEEETLLDQQFLNGTDGSFDTNVLQSDVLSVPVSVSALGLPAGRSTVGYRVVTESLDAAPVVLDETPRQVFDVAAPAVSVLGSSATGGSVLFRDRPGTTLQVTRAATTTGAFGGVLLLHHHNANGQRAEVISVTTTAPQDPGTPVTPVSPTASTSPTGTASPSAPATSAPSVPPTTSPTGTATTPAPSVPADCSTPASVTLGQATIVATGGGQVTVTGRPGTVVDLLAYTQPDRTFRVVRTTDPLGSSGSQTFTVRPAANTRLYAQQRGCTTDAARDSKVLNVRTALSLFAQRTGTRSYVFSGDSLPARPGGLIVSLYRVTQDGRQVLTSQTRADARTGEWRIARRFTGSGRFGFVVRTAQDLQNAPGSSNVRSTLVF